MSKQSYPRPIHILMSAVLPGFGQLLGGRFVLGGVLTVLGCLCAAIYAYGSLRFTYRGWIAGVLAILMCLIISVWLAFAARGDNDTSPRRWWALTVALFVSLLSTGLWMILLTRAVGLRPVSLGSASMEPTVYVGDKFFIDTKYYTHHTLQDGDIIAFRHHEYILIKRISGLPGETVEGRNGVLIRNGVPLQEPYIRLSPDHPIPQIETFGPHHVAESELFLTGDSRDQSLDSRSDEFGPVKVADVFGKLTFIYDSKHDQTGRSF